MGGPDFSSQTSANTNILGINLAAEFNERIRFVTQYITVLGYTLTNPNNNPGLAPTERQFGTPTFGSLVAQAYVEYRKSELLVFQTGIDGFTDAYYGWIRSYCKIT